MWDLGVMRVQGGVREGSGRVRRGISLIRKRPLPRTHHRALCIVLLQGPRRALFLMGEITLYRVFREGMERI